MKKKILVVEDDKNIALALALRLKSAGYEVCSAYDAATGVMVARNEQPDLLIIDIAMPAGGGFAVGERVQSLNGTIGTPMIFMTASKQENLVERAESLGAVGFLQKPYDNEVMLSTVRAALGEPEPVV